MTHKLSLYQQEILIKFIVSFLPKRGNKRKGSKNEIKYISTTLDRIFSKYFNFYVTAKHILDALEQLQYSIFLKKSIWDADKKEYIPSNQGINVRLDNFYKDYEAAFIYVDIEPAIVGRLRLATAGLPPQTNRERQDEKEEMNKRIYLFKQTIKTEAV